jgi:hypothetical protein
MDKEEKRRKKNNKINGQNFDATDGFLKAAT